MAGLRRRTVLGAGALAAVAGVAGCTSVARSAGLGDFLRIAVSWSATELAAFRNVLAGRGVDDVDLIPFGDDIDASLGVRTTGRPNLVALPRPGLVAGNIANLEPLPDDLWQPRYDEIWSQSLPTGRQYALPFKLAHKSVVWYRKKVFAEHGLQPPDTWQKWLELNDRIVAEPSLGAPLALGGADGWMLAGVLENILLRNFSDTYDALATPRHDRRLWQSGNVRTAFTMLGELWGRPGVFAGGPKRALVQQFPDAMLEVFKYHTATMVVAPDFAESVIRLFGVPSDEVETFTFPPLTAPGGPLVAAGDLFVLTRPAQPRAVELIRYLGEPRAPVPWIRDTGGFIAANPLTDYSFYSPMLARLSHELRDRPIRFDLADQLGPAGGRDGLQLVLQNFLQSVAGGRSRDDAVRTALAAMVSAEAG
jgi:alpha-glucoside transport system substrate-binding protein